MPALRAVLAEASYSPPLLRDASIALGLLGERDLGALLGERLRASKSLAAQASLAQAIGKVGDASVIGPLVDMLSDEALSERARAFCAVALGSASDPDPLPWNTTLSLHGNYVAAPQTLYDAFGFGILNIL